MQKMQGVSGMSTGDYPPGMTQADHDKEFDGKDYDDSTDRGDYLYEMEKDRRLDYGPGDGIHSGDDCS